MTNFSDYILIFNQKSPLINRLTSDTLMGGFLYYLSLFDKQKFLEFYDKFCLGEPPFLTSSFFPYFYLPVNGNFLLSFVKEKENLSVVKKIKKISFVEEGFFEEKDKEGFLFRKIEEKDESYYLHIKREMVNIKDKKENQGQALPYTIDGYYFKDKKGYFLLRIFEEKEKDFIIDFFKQIFNFGIGKRVSVNFNHFEFEDLRKIELKNEGESFLNLSFCQFKGEEKNLIEPLFFDIEEKNPRLGPIFSLGRPFKKSFFGIKEGGVFKAKDKRPFFGMVNKSLYPKENFLPIQIVYCLPYYFYYEKNFNYDFGDN